MTGGANDTPKTAPAELVARIRRGDQAAKAELYTRYAPRLLRILRRETQDEDRALDICQQAFLIVLEKLEGAGPDDPEKLGGFIYGIAKNLLRSGWRQAERRKTDADTELVERVAAEETNPYLQVSEQQLAEAVRASIEQLAIGRDREIAYRLFLDEADPAIVCEELEVTREHLSRLRYRVLKRLREVLTPEARQAAESLGIGERNSP